ncbi:MAG TPA: protease complex subunit PrcB family protein [Chthoniobacteraceae bacterium]|nr:protease complex subunit PrcB family protein [Chthoniobacteraceae bacterium]
MSKSVTLRRPGMAMLLLAFAFPVISRAQDQKINASAPPPSTIAGFSPDVQQRAVAEMKQWRGLYGDDKAHTDIVTTAADWAKFWQRLGLGAHEPLNEKNEVAVCIFVGECPTAGYKPQIISAVEREGNLVVSWSRGKPGANAMVAQEVTHPWVAAVLPKTALHIVFKEI